MSSKCPSCDTCSNCYRRVDTGVVCGDCDGTAELRAQLAEAERERDELHSALVTHDRLADEVSANLRAAVDLGNRQLAEVQAQAAAMREALLNFAPDESAPERWWATIDTAVRAALAPDAGVALLAERDALRDERDAARRERDASREAYLTVADAVAPESDGAVDLAAKARATRGRLAEAERERVAAQVNMFEAERQQAEAESQAAAFWPKCDWCEKPAHALYDFESDGRAPLCVGCAKSERYDGAEVTIYADAGRALRAELASLREVAKFAWHREHCQDPGHCICGYSDALKAVTDA